jgi:hypothetical protein
MSNPSSAKIGQGVPTSRSRPTLPGTPSSPLSLLGICFWGGALEGAVEGAGVPVEAVEGM